MTTTDGPSNAVASAGTQQRRMCARCGYDLKGLPESGACPECGQAFDPSTVVSHPPLSTFELCLRFGWPVMILAFVLALSAARSELICLGALLFPVIMINGVAQYGAWRGIAVPPGLRDQPGVPRFVPLRRFAFVLAVICLIGPPVVFGGCVVLVFWELQYGGPH